MLLYYLIFHFSSLFSYSNVFANYMHSCFISDQKIKRGSRRHLEDGKNLIEHGSKTTYTKIIGADSRTPVAAWQLAFLNSQIIFGI